MKRMMVFVFIMVCGSVSAFTPVCEENEVLVSRFGISKCRQVGDTEGFHLVCKSDERAYSSRDAIVCVDRVDTLDGEVTEDEVKGVDDGVFYTPNITMSIEDFMGECDVEGVESGELMAIGECAGNFFDPRIPNPMGILTPFSTDNLNVKYDNLKSMGEDSGIIGFLTNLIILPLKLIVMVFSTLIELIFNIIKYLLVFSVRWLLTYTLYVSMGFQAVFRGFNQGSVFEQMDKVKFTTAFMLFASIITLTVGGGWIQW